MSDETRETVPIAQPRGYQLELFEASMNQNVIITVRMVHEAPGLNSSLMIM